MKITPIENLYGGFVFLLISAKKIVIYRPLGFLFAFLKSRTVFLFAPCRVAQGEVSDVLDIEVEAFAPLFRSPGRNIPLE